MKALLFLIITISPLPVSAAELNSRLAPIAETYSKGIKDITERCVTEKTKALEAYLIDLKDSETKATKGGDVKALSAITREISDVEKGLALPVPPPDLPKLLQTRHKAYVKAFDTADEAAAKEKEALDGKYLSALAKLQPTAGTDPELATQVDNQKKRVLSKRFGPITNLQTQLPGSRWQSVKEPADFWVFTPEGIYHKWKYTIPDAETVVIHWNENSNEAWKLTKDGKVLLRNGQPDLRIAAPAVE